MKTRKRTRVLGMLDERRRYSAKGLLKHGGLGSVQRAAMLASGIVKPIDIGCYRWYRGAEVCRWIDSQSK